MPFPASTVGLDLPAHERTFTTRSVLAYAAGLGVSDPAYLDDKREGGLLALPFQCVSAEWPLLLALRELLAGELTVEESQRGVHASQDSIFHRPVRAGERVVTEGRLTGARRIRSGVLATCKLTTSTAETGELLTTSWTRSVYRDVELSGGDTEVEAAPPAVTPGVLEPTATEVFQVPRGMPHVYSECADIWNPIHTERAVAIAAGLPDIILHGTATWALAGLHVLGAYAGADVRRLARFAGSFKAMVVPGETIMLESAPDGREVRVEVANSSGARALAEGVAVLRPG